MPRASPLRYARRDSTFVESLNFDRDGRERRAGMHRLRRASGAPDPIAPASVFEVPRQEIPPRLDGADACEWASRLDGK